MILALTRPVPLSIGACELTHLERRPIDIGVALLQHEAYESCLRELGCRVQQLPAAPELPDSVFVEDTALVLDELAVLLRPGAVSRRPELAAVAEALVEYRELRRIEAPGTIDGGDVLWAGGRRVFVGATARSDRNGIEQLRVLLAPFGYAVQAVPVRGCLHLKSAVTQVAPEMLLINPDFVGREAFDGFELIEVDPREPSAANALRVGADLVYDQAYPGTLERLEARELRPRLLDASELAKAEGALTCCSLLVPLG